MMLACSALNDGHVSLFRCKGKGGEITGLGAVREGAMGPFSGSLVDNDAVPGAGTGIVREYGE